MFKTALLYYLNQYADDFPQPWLRVNCFNVRYSLDMLGRPSDGAIWSGTETVLSYSRLCVFIQSTISNPSIYELYPHIDNTFEMQRVVFFTLPFFKSFYRDTGDILRLTFQVHLLHYFRCEVIALTYDRYVLVSMCNFVF